MTTIWKWTQPYPLLLDGEFDLAMPRDPVVLHVGSQGDRTQRDVVTLWAWVNTDNPEQFYRFKLAATGQAVDEDRWHYLGTAVLFGGAEIYHMFQERR